MWRFSALNVVPSVFQFSGASKMLPFQMLMPSLKSKAVINDSSTHWKLDELIYKSAHFLFDVLKTTLFWVAPIALLISLNELNISWWFIVTFFNSDIRCCCPARYFLIALKHPVYVPEWTSFRRNQKNFFKITPHNCVFTKIFIKLRDPWAILASKMVEFLQDVRRNFREGFGSC